MKTQCKITFTIVTLLVINSISLYSNPNQTMYMQVPSTVCSYNESPGEPLGSDNLVYWPITTITWDYNVADCQETSPNTINALGDAFEVWDNVTTANLTFDQGQSIAPPSLSDEGHNILFFESDGDSIRNKYNFPSSRFASTYISTNTSPFIEIEDVDIIFNAYDYTWTAGTTNVESDDTVVRIQVIATHEIGHLLGIHHHSDSLSTSIMNTELPLHNMTSYSLHSDDEFSV